MASDWVKIATVSSGFEADLTWATASFVVNWDIGLSRPINPRPKSLEEWLTGHRNGPLPG